MIKFDIITIFPKIFDSYFNESIIKRAQNPPPLMDKSSISGRKAQSIKGGGKIKINIVDLRKFSTDKHKKIDDKPFGGGPGMVFKIEPLVKAINSILPHLNPPLNKGRKKEGFKKTKIILFSAAGKQFDSKMAKDWAKKYNHIIMIAGHYEGVDERIKKIFKVEEISIGPYVLTGGELPAMVVVDAVSRYIPGVLGKKKSLEEKRLGIGVPVYTRPEVFKWHGRKYVVPKVLLSGNHKKIEQWRKTRSLAS